MFSPFLFCFTRRWMALMTHRTRFGGDRVFSMPAAFVMRLRTRRPTTNTHGRWHTNSHAIDDLHSFSQHSQHSSNATALIAAAAAVTSLCIAFHAPPCTSAADCHVLEAMRRTSPSHVSTRQHSHKLSNLGAFAAIDPLALASYQILKVRSSIHNSVSIPSTSSPEISVHARPGFQHADVGKDLLRGLSSCPGGPAGRRRIPHGQESR